MTTFKPGDRVIVTIDGHDTEWTVVGEYCPPDRANRLGLRRLADVGVIGEITAQIPTALARPVPMEEPTKFGAMVEDDFGLLVRIYDPSYRALGDSAWIRQNVSFQTYRWSELKNPRPYTGGDDD